MTANKLKYHTTASLPPAAYPFSKVLAFSGLVKKEEVLHVSQGNRRQSELETPTNTSLPPPYFKKYPVGATPDRDINRV